MHSAIRRARIVGVSKSNDDLQFLSSQGKVSIQTSMNFERLNAYISYRHDRMALDDSHPF